jgi:hypothetical protein
MWRVNRRVAQQRSHARTSSIGQIATQSRRDAQYHLLSLARALSRSGRCFLDDKGFARVGESPYPGASAKRAAPGPDATKDAPWRGAGRRGMRVFRPSRADGPCDLELSPLRGARTGLTVRALTAGARPNKRSKWHWARLRRSQCPPTSACSALTCAAAEFQPAGRHVEERTIQL